MAHGTLRWCPSTQVALPAIAHFQHAHNIEASTANLTTYEWIISQLLQEKTEKIGRMDISLPVIFLKDVCHKSLKGKKQKKRSGILPSAMQKTSCDSAWKSFWVFPISHYHSAQISHCETKSPPARCSANAQETSGGLQKRRAILAPDILKMLCSRPLKSNSEIPLIKTEAPKITSHIL